MEKLAGSYVGAAATMGTSAVPTFAPLPSALMPPTRSGTLTNVPVPGGLTSKPGAPFGRGTSTIGSGFTGKGHSSVDSRPGTSAATLTAIQPSGTSGGITSAAGGGTAIQGRGLPSALPSESSSVGVGGMTGEGTSAPTRDGGWLRPQIPGTGDVAHFGRPVGRDAAVRGGWSGDTEGNGSPVAWGASGGASRDADVASTAPVGDGGLLDAASGMGKADDGISGGTISPLATASNFGGSALGAGAAGVASAAPQVGDRGVVGAGSGDHGAVTGSSTAVVGLTDRKSSNGQVAAEAVAGQNPSSSEMVPMGGLSRSGKSCERARRAGYLVEDAEVWTSGIPEANPAVIE
jgi:hypothetical protein